MKKLALFFTLFISSYAALGADMSNGADTLEMACVMDSRLSNVRP